MDWCASQQKYTMISVSVRWGDVIVMMKEPVKSDAMYVFHSEIP